ncbi:hypothetical protein VTI28DRAFT_5396 [Corynascus sepedonium]
MSEGQLNGKPGYRLDPMLGDQNIVYKVIFGIHSRDADYKALDDGTAPNCGPQKLSTTWLSASFRTE